MSPDEVAPILVLGDSETRHRFSSYVTEILHIEGYNWFTVHDLSRESLTPELLDDSSLVILTHVEPSTDVQELLLAFLRRGGNLIALRPPEELAAALGLNSSEDDRDIVDRYLAFNGHCALNAGVDLSPLQFHGRGEQYTWSGEPNSVLAYFAAFPDYVTNSPAIVVGTLGQGHWAVFAYDLAESTVLFHQGRREQASTGSSPDADGNRQYKPNDLFVGYLDPNLGSMPQADLHQDALVRVFEWMASLSRPLPRLWYFPRAARAVAFINGDSDRMSHGDIASVIATADRFGAPFTNYVKTEHYSEVDPGWERDQRARGHDFGQHAFAGNRPSLDTMRSRLREELGAFRSRYGHDSVTYRGHSVIWVGWTEMAQYLRENRVRLDTNFSGGRFHRGAYVNGSGLPVKFMDEEGKLLDIYEQATMSTDDGSMTDKVLAPALTIDECIALSRRQADFAINRYHTVYHPYFHPRRTRPGPMSTQRWLESVLEHCRDRGFHFVNGSDWVSFNDGRRSLRLAEYRFDEGAMAVDLALETEMAVTGATMALPYVYRGHAMTAAHIDGEPVPIEPQQLEGRRQVLLSADYASGGRRRWHIQWGSGLGGQ